MESSSQPSGPEKKPTTNRPLRSKQLDGGGRDGGWRDDEQVRDEGEGLNGRKGEGGSMKADGGTIEANLGHIGPRNGSVHFLIKIGGFLVYFLLVCFC